jgi:signal transduction histidine kinase
MKFIYLLLLFLIAFTSVSQKAPDLSRLKTSKEKLHAWAVYCDEIVAKGDLTLLRVPGKLGIKMTPVDDFENVSLFNFFIGTSFSYQTEYDSAIFYLEKSAEQIHKAKNKKRAPDVLYELLYAYKSLGNTSKREKLAEDFQKIIDTTTQLSRKGILMSNLSDYYFNIGQYETGLQYAINGIEARRATLEKGSQTDSVNFGIKLINIAEHFLRMKNSKKGIEYLREGELHVKSYKVAVLYVHKLYAVFYLNMDSVKKAEFHYIKLLSSLSKDDDNSSWDALLATDLSIADYYVEKKEYQSALKYINHAEGLAPQYASQFMKGSIHYVSGQVYLGLKQYEKALMHLKAAEPAAREDEPEALGWVQDALAKTYAAMGNWKMAYQYQSEYSILRDTLLTEKAKKNLAEMESKYQNDKKQEEIVALSLENTIKSLEIDSAKKQKWFFVGGLSLLAIIGALLFYQSRNRRKTNETLLLFNQELDEANKIKTRFFSILNHDLRSPVANLINFLHLQKENPELIEGESRLRLENRTITGAENLLTSMEDILLWSKGQMENFKPQLKKVLVSTIFEDTQKHFDSEQKVKITFEITENIQLFTDEDYLKTIIRNLTGNAIKALVKTESPLITWKAWQKDNQIYLSITDNGSGGEQEQFKALYNAKEVVGIKSGLGLHLIRDLAKAIGCEINVESKLGEGTAFTLVLA